MYTNILIVSLGLENFFFKENKTDFKNAMKNKTGNCRPNFSLILGPSLNFRKEACAFCAILIIRPYRRNLYIVVKYGR